MDTLFAGEPQSFPTQAPFSHIGGAICSAPTLAFDEPTGQPLSMSESNAWYDEERADEAALALFWVGAADHRDHPSDKFPADILSRLQERRLIARGEQGFTFTELGRTKAKAAFNRLFGKPVAATIVPPPKTHVVEEFDGD